MSLQANLLSGIFATLIKRRILRLNKTICLHLKQDDKPRQKYGVGKKFLLAVLRLNTALIDKSLNQHQYITLPSKVVYHYNQVLSCCLLIEFSKRPKTTYKQYEVCWNVLLNIRLDLMARAQNKNKNHKDFCA
jgi:hypothetical protein